MKYFQQLAKMKERSIFWPFIDFWIHEHFILLTLFHARVRYAVRFHTGETEMAAPIRISPHCDDPDCVELIFTAILTDVWSAKPGDLQGGYG